MHGWPSMWMVWAPVHHWSPPGVLFGLSGCRGLPCWPLVLPVRRFASRVLLVPPVGCLASPWAFLVCRWPSPWSFCQSFCSPASSCPPVWLFPRVVVHASPLLMLPLHIGVSPCRPHGCGLLPAAISAQWWGRGRSPPLSFAPPASSSMPPLRC